MRVAIGTALATALPDVGGEVNVGTAARSGPKRSPKITEAVDGRGPLAQVCPTDHAAVVQVLPAVVLTTGTPEDAVRTGRLLRSQGLEDVDAGIQTVPEDIGTPRATLPLAEHLPVRRNRATPGPGVGGLDTVADLVGGLFARWHDGVGLTAVLDQRLHGG